MASENNEDACTSNTMDFSEGGKFEFSHVDRGKNGEISVDDEGRIAIFYELNGSYKSDYWSKEDLVCKNFVTFVPTSSDIVDRKCYISVEEHVAAMAARSAWNAQAPEKKKPKMEDYAMLIPRHALSSVPAASFVSNGTPPPESGRVTSLQQLGIHHVQPGQQTRAPNYNYNYPPMTQSQQQQFGFRHQQMVSSQQNGVHHHPFNESTSLAPSQQNAAMYQQQSTLGAPFQQFGFSGLQGHQGLTNHPAVHDYAPSQPGSCSTSQSIPSAGPYVNSASNMKPSLPSGMAPPPIPPLKMQLQASKGGTLSTSQLHSFHDGIRTQRAKGKAIAKATGFTIDLVCLQKGEELTAVTDADDLVQLKRGGMGEATVTLESNMKGTAVDEKVYEAFPALKFAYHNNRKGFFYAKRVGCGVKLEKKFNWDTDASKLKRSPRLYIVPLADLVPQEYSDAARAAEPLDVCWKCSQTVPKSEYILHVQQCGKKKPTEKGDAAESGEERT